MTTFAGKAFVVRIDRTAATNRDSTLIADLGFLARERVRPIVVAPDASCARSLVRTINRGGNVAVGLSGADAAMLPGTPRGLGQVQTGILRTLTEAGYIPVVEPTSFSAFGEEAMLDADDVAQAIAAATEAVRAIFFHALGGVPDPRTEAMISELTPAEALAIAGDARVPADLRAAIRAAARGVRAGVPAAQIVDGRVANALLVEVLTAQHLGTQVAGAIYRGAA